MGRVAAPRAEAAAGTERSKAAAPAAGRAKPAPAEQSLPEPSDNAAGAARPMRADAQRNRAQLLVAAHDAFTERGDAASLEDIARRAGVGVGTLYRHFPTRQDLLEAVYVEEVEALCRSAEDLIDEEPWPALVRWFNRFVDYVVTKHALVEELMTSIGREAAVFRTCHTAIFDVGEPLLDRAKAAGVVRPDLQFIDVIRLVSGITMVKGASTDDIRRVLAVAMDGLRYGIDSPVTVA